MPKIAIARCRSSAVVCRLISVATFFRPGVRKWVAPYSLENLEPMLDVGPASGSAFVPRGSFDVCEGAFRRDDDGTECTDFEASRREAMATLPDVARWAMAPGGERQAYSVLIGADDRAIV